MGARERAAVGLVVSAVGLGILGDLLFQGRPLGVNAGALRGRVRDRAGGDSPRRADPVPSGTAADGRAAARVLGAAGVARLAAAARREPARCRGRGHARSASPYGAAGEPGRGVRLRRRCGVGGRRDLRRRGQAVREGHAVAWSASALRRRARRRDRPRSRARAAAAAGVRRALRRRRRGVPEPGHRRRARTSGTTGRTCSCAARSAGWRRACCATCSRRARTSGCSARRSTRSARRRRARRRDGARGRARVVERALPRVRRRPAPLPLRRQRPRRVARAPDVRRVRAPRLLRARRRRGARAAAAARRARARARPAASVGACSRRCRRR